MMATFRKFAFYTTSSRSPSSGTTPNTASMATFQILMSFSRGSPSCRVSQERYQDESPSPATGPKPIRLFSPKRKRVPGTRPSASSIQERRRYHATLWRRRPQSCCEAALQAGKPSPA
ncbi:MAG: hypothetical protein JWL84_6260 [Rhodospirillales bacterium]|nr:hypothetical protein [Rhodospirillales bacterium]